MKINKRKAEIEAFVWESDFGKKKNLETLLGGGDHME